jgi:precorrin-8X/cobalt-precorrin-8 methylmutase
MPGPEEGKSADNRTRAEKGIELGLKDYNAIGIIAIGNAPTALLKVIEIFNSPAAPSPFPLVIGVPVGFVKAFESKALLSSQSFPFITNLSRKGGSPVAAAIVNALLKMAEEGK